MMANLKFLVFLLVFGAGQLASADEPQTDSRQRAQAHAELGGAYFSQGQLGVALDELKTAVSADSSYAPAYNMLGLVYMALHEDVKADENFRRALRLNDADPDAHNNYGWFLCQSGKVDDSIPHFMAALKSSLYATPEKPYLNAGVCSRKKGNDADAEEFLLKSIQLQPRQPQALFNLADIYFKRANDSEAKKYITQFFRISAPTLESLSLGIRIEHRLGNRSDEASYALQLRKMFPDSPEAQALRNGK